MSTLVFKLKSFFNKMFWMEFTSSGYPIWIGKSAKQNDQLTFQLAHKKDLWFHIDQTSGPHIILHCEGKPVTDQDLQETCEITRRYSKSKNKVIYTQILNVEKKKHSKAGEVYITNPSWQ